MELAALAPWDSRCGSLPTYLGWLTITNSGSAFTCVW